MSRTYRLRHLPALPGAPRKYGDSEIHERRFRGLRYPGWRFTLERHARERELEDAPDPIGHPCEHPWVGYGLAGVNKAGKKKLSRTHGNRAYRRACSTVLRFADPECAVYPERRWFVDPWDLT